MNTEEINSELANPFKNTNRAEREQAKTAPQIYWRAVFSAFALSPLGLGKAQYTGNPKDNWKGFEE